MSTLAGEIRIITPTHSVIDRLSAAVFWRDAQALAQAKLVANHQTDLIDWPEIDRWVLAEGVASAPEVAALYRETGRRVP